MQLYIAAQSGKLQFGDVIRDAGAVARDAADGENPKTHDADGGSPQTADEAVVHARGCGHGPRRARGAGPG